MVTRTGAPEGLVVARSSAHWPLLHAGALGAAIRKQRSACEDSESGSDWDVDERELGEQGALDFEDEYHFSAAEEAAFDAFMEKGNRAMEASEGVLLSDIILSKMRQASRQAEEAVEPAEPSGPACTGTMAADVVDIYTDVGKLLQRCVPAAAAGCRI
jgi:hypothetical protein